MFADDGVTTTADSQSERTGLPVFIGVIDSRVQFRICRSNPFFRATRTIGAPQERLSASRSASPTKKAVAEGDGLEMRCDGGSTQRDQLGLREP
jgi:hypothetical protein